MQEFLHDCRTVGTYHSHTRTIQCSYGLFNGVELFLVNVILIVSFSAGEIGHATEPVSGSYTATD